MDSKIDGKTITDLADRILAERKDMRGYMDIAYHLGLTADGFRIIRRRGGKERDVLALRALLAGLHRH